MRRPGLARRTLQASAVLLLAVAAVFVVLTTSIIGLRDANRAERQASKVAATAHEVQTLAQNSQTSVRRYADDNTNDELLQPWEGAKTELPAKTAELSRLVEDSAAQTKAAAAIAGATEKYLNEYLTGLVAVARTDPGRARTLAAGESERHLNAIRDQVQRFTANQQALVRARQERSDSDARRARAIGDGALIAAVLLFVLFGIYMQRLIVNPIRQVAAATQQLAAGDLSTRLPSGGSVEVAELSDSFNAMAQSLQQHQQQLLAQSNQLAGQKADLEQTLGQLATEKGRVEVFSRLSARFAAETELEPLAQLVMDELGSVVEADVGTLYALGSDDDEELELVATRHLDAAHLPAHLDLGQGGAGRAAAEKTVVAASLGPTGPRVRALGQEVVVHHELNVPLVQAGRTIGVMMLGRTGDSAFSATEREGVEQLADPTAIALANALALRSARRQARITGAILDTAYDAFIAIDADGLITDWNSRAEAIFGWPAGEAVGKRLTETIIPERHREAHTEGIRRFLETGEGRILDGTVELSALHREGYEIPVELALSALNLEGTYRFNAFLRDITARKQAEAQLRESRERFANAFEQAPIGVAIASVEGRLLDVNEPFVEITGHAREGLLHKTLESITHPDDRDIGADRLRRVLAGEARVFELERRLVNADGQTVWTHQNGSAIRGGRGEPLYLILQVQDISERKQAEQYTEMQHGVTYVLSEAPTVDDAMPRVLQMFGLTLEWDAAAFWSLDPESKRFELTAFWELPDAGASRLAEQVPTRGTDWGSDFPGRAVREGQPLWIEDVEQESMQRTRAAAAAGLRSAVAVPVSSGPEILGVVELYSRERKQPRADLIEVMTTTGNQIGQFLSRKRTEATAQQFKDDLLGLVSQELRTPLTSIIGYVELARESEAGGENGSLAVIDRNAQRILRIVDDLMVAVEAEKGALTLELGTVDLAALATTRIEAAQELAVEYGVRLRPILAPATTYVGDRDLLAQMIDNLITNVIRLTRKDAEIEVRTATEDNLAVFEVTDPGVGIPRSREEQLFERFTHAASAGQPVIPGVGIGFALVQGIAEAHHGQVAVHTGEGAGTTVRVELPVHSAAGHGARIAPAGGA